MLALGAGGHSYTPGGGGGTALPVHEDRGLCHWLVRRICFYGGGSIPKCWRRAGSQASFAVRLPVAFHVGKTDSGAQSLLLGWGKLIPFALQLSPREPIRERVICRPDVSGRCLGDRAVGSGGALGKKGLPKDRPLVGGRGLPKSALQPQLGGGSDTPSLDLPV